MKTVSGVLSVLSAFVATAALAKNPPKPPHMVTEDQAKVTALKAYNGVVKSSELEYEHGLWIYSFDIAYANGGKSTHEINVDAVSGKLISQEIENAQDEKKEQIEESQGAK